MVNLLPNSWLSKLKVTSPTIVKVVKNATDGTMLAPISTIEPTSGNATKAGIKVTASWLLLGGFFMGIEHYKNLISHTHLFNQFSPNDISTLFIKDYYKIKDYERDSIIYLQNEVCNTIDIVLGGSVHIQKIDENGGILTIATYTTGDIMGANLAFSKANQYPMTVISNTQSTVLHINKKLILNLCQNDRNFLIKFLETLSSKALILTNKIKFISMKTIRDKIIEFLTYEYHLQNSPVIKLQVSKKELAERFGIQRPSLFRELRKMKEDGLIDYDSRSITIVDMELLKKRDGLIT